MKALCLFAFLPLAVFAQEKTVLRYRSDAGTVLRYRVRIVNQQDARAGEHTQSVTFERTGRRTLLVFDRTPDPPRFTLSSEDTMQDATLLAYSEDGKDRLEAVRADIQPSLPRGSHALAFFTLDDRGGEQEDLSKLPLDAALLRSLSDIQVLPEEAVAPGATWKRELSAGPIDCKYEYTLAAGPVISTKFTVSTQHPPEGAALSFEPGEATMRFDAASGQVVSLSGKVGVIATAPGKEDRLTLTLELTLDGVERLSADALTQVAQEGGFLATVYRAYETGIIDRASLGLEEFLQKYPESRWRAGAKTLLDGLRTTFPLLLCDAPPLSVKEWIGAAPETKGHVTLIAFFATWEPNCRAAVPALSAWAEAFGKQGLIVAGVTSLDDRQDRAGVGEFVAQQGVKFPVAIDDGEKTFGAFRTATIPHLFLLDKRGRVRWEGHPSQAAVVEYLIRTLLAE